MQADRDATPALRVMRSRIEDLKNEIEATVQSMGELGNRRQVMYFYSDDDYFDADQPEYNMYEIQLLEKESELRSLRARLEVLEKEYAEEQLRWQTANDILARGNAQLPSLPPEIRNHIASFLV